MTEDGNFELLAKHGGKADAAAQGETRKPPAYP